MNSGNNNTSGNNNSPIYSRSTCEGEMPAIIECFDNLEDLNEYLNSTRNEEDDMPELIECFDNSSEYLDNNNYVNTRGGVEIPDIINYFNKKYKLINTI